MGSQSECASRFPGDFVTPRITALTPDSDSAHLVWAPEFAFLNMLPCAADAAGPGTSL